MTAPMVSLRSVGRRYDFDAVIDVDLDLYAGQMTALTGPTGAGKSTLARIIAGIDEPTTGTVTRAEGFRAAWLVLAVDRLPGSRPQVLGVSNTPALVIADDPTFGLSERGRQDTIAILEAFAHDEGAAVLVITHRRDVCRAADVAHEMKEGRLCRTST